MEKAWVDMMLKVDMDGDTPYIESRSRVISGEDPELPAGKVMVMRTPILPPGASEEDYRNATTTEIVDSEHPDDPLHCEECAKLGLSPHFWLENMQFGPPRPHVGRNDPCPCGSGRKYKRCCLLS
jgi:hypothetical protein